jgi:hypothetical protein
MPRFFVLRRIRRQRFTLAYFFHLRQRGNGLYKSLLVVMPVLPMGAMVAVARVSAAFGLERDLHPCKIRSEAKEHILDHVIRPNAKNLVSNFSRQMPISQMPRQARQLVGIFMSDFDNELRRGLNLEPSTIFELQAISISHGNRLGKVEQDIFALIPSQTNAASMPRIEIESERAGRFFRRPIPGESMNGCAMSGIATNGGVMRS